MLENQLNHNLTQKGNFFLESSRGWSTIESRCLNFALKNWSFTMFFFLLLALFSRSSSSPLPPLVLVLCCVYFWTSHYGKVERIRIVRAWLHAHSWGWIWIPPHRRVLSCILFLCVYINCF